LGVGSLVIATTVGIAYISAVLALAVHALIAGYYMADLRRPGTPGRQGFRGGQLVDAGQGLRVIPTC
jgi:hypothetical protein